MRDMVKDMILKLERKSSLSQFFETFYITFCEYIFSKKFHSIILFSEYNLYFFCLKTIIIANKWPSIPKLMTCK